MNKSCCNCKERVSTHYYDLVKPYEFNYFWCSSCIEIFNHPDHRKIIYTHMHPIENKPTEPSWFDLIPE